MKRIVILQRYIDKGEVMNLLKSYEHKILYSNKSVIGIDGYEIIFKKLNIERCRDLLKYRDDQIFILDRNASALRNIYNKKLEREVSIQIGNSNKILESINTNKFKRYVLQYTNINSIFIPSKVKEIEVFLNKEEKNKSIVHHIGVTYYKNYNEAKKELRKGASPYKEELVKVGSQINDLLCFLNEEGKDE